MTKIVEAKTHYDMLVDEGVDFVNDNEILKQYMKNWDGDLFYNSLELNKNKDVLEVGVGTGRIAIEVITMGLRSFEGIDISVKTIERAKRNLLKFKDIINLKVEDINDYNTENKFDLVYSVLTLIHIEDKEKALRNMINSLKKEGLLVLSLTNDNNDMLDYGNRLIKIYPENKDYYINVIRGLGCNVISVQVTNDNFATIIKAKKS